ncbi:MAG: hypothetical protein M3527_10585 [Actinomycetota bacterium]|nr:hypothetical protein [Acidimicrobiia bacterium]MDQ3294875.1 hypothetical protein [Actinomycetota bacterium]
MRGPPSIEAQVVRAEVAFVGTVVDGAVALPTGGLAFGITIDKVAAIVVLGALVAGAAALAGRGGAA